MNGLERLAEWAEKERGRSVELWKPCGYYGPHDWEITLWNVDMRPEENWVKTEFNENKNYACVVAVDGKVSNPKYKNADNFISEIKESDLEELINKAIDKAEELGL